jgi:D-alanyl-D-alanine carboxypeptidase
MRSGTKAEAPFWRRPVVVIPAALLLLLGAVILYLRPVPIDPDLAYPPDAPPREQARYVMGQHLVHRGGAPVHSFVLYLENEPAGLVIHEGVGIVGRTDTPIDGDYQYNVASITKMFVAAIVLQLVEEGRLALDDRAVGYLGGLDFLDTGALHVLDGTSHASEITIDHLLQHRSGLGDVFIDTATRFNLHVLLNRRQQYSPQAIMELFFEYGLNEAPHFAPGDGYYYSDINYVLLGLIIEGVTGESLPAEIRRRVLEPLGLSATYFEYYEPPTGPGKRLDSYLGRLNMTRDFNTSYEWAGGGLVSTAEDMATFIRALFDLELFEDPGTLALMLDPGANQDEGTRYGRGIIRYDVDGTTYFGHGGFYGSLLLHQPEEGITLSANVAQASPPFDAMAAVRTLLQIAGAHSTTPPPPQAVP